MPANEPKNVIYGLYALDDPERRIRYVGQAKNGIRERFAGHRSCARRDNPAPVYRWMRKHGVENIEAVILDCAGAADQLDDLEIRWISKLGTYRGEFGLNMTTGGEGAHGLVISDEVRAKLSAAAKARGMGHIDRTELLWATLGEKSWNAVFTEECVLDIKHRLWSGEPMSVLADEYGVSRSAISHINQNRSWTHVPWPIGPRREMRTAELHSQIVTGRKHSEESIAKMSDSAIASWTDERRAKASTAFSGANNPQYGTKWSDERRAEASLARSPIDIDDVREIKRLRVEEGLQYKEIADIIGKGVGFDTVGKICRGEKFRHVA